MSGPDLQEPTLEPDAWPLERMDEPDVDSEHLANCLDHLARLSRWSGAYRAIRREAVRLLPVTGRVRVADVGAGGGDVLRMLARHLGDRLESGLALEPHAATAACGRDRCGSDGRFSVLRADARDLPLRTGSVDLAMMHMALHHLPPGDRVDALEDLGRVANGRVLVTDLARNMVNRIGARLLAETLWRSNPLVRNDAPVSVARGFTGPELLALARDAALPCPEVRSLWGHRLVLSTGGSPTARSTSRGGA